LRERRQSYSYNPADDEAFYEETIVKAQKGDDRALEQIIEKYKGVVRAKSRSYFLIGADWEDLVQEGMIGLYKAIRDFRPQKRLPFWAFAEMCITRQIITAIKTATRKKHIPLNSYISLSTTLYEDEFSDDPPPEMLSIRDINDPEEMVINREKLDNIETKLDKVLSNLERYVLNLYLRGDAYYEISEKVGKDVKSIDNALQRVKRKLLKYLEDERT